MLKTVSHLLRGAAYRGRRIGLLGGSFNPAHEGHLHISLLALKAMRLDEIWWLVSPQNPLKTSTDMASLAERIAGAEALTAKHPRLIVTDIETRINTRFTADTLKKLKARFPTTRFVWMMGADNLLQIPRWQRWPSIFAMADVAVFRRPSYAASCVRGAAAIRFAHKRLAPGKAHLLARCQTPRWILFSNRLNPLSATQIRNAQKGKNHASQKNAE